jgi:predicted amidohydrolase
MRNLKLLKSLFPTLLLISVILLINIKVNASEKIGRPVRVVSLSFHGNNISEILKIVDAEGSKGTDIIVLPETWRGDQLLEPIDGESITELSKLAKKHNTYIISPIERKIGNHHYNTAVLLDREGKIVGMYDKVFPYWGEFDLNPPVEPGLTGAPVFDTDFGKIGIAICYDANFPEVWQELKNNGAELVFWPSAYSAGLQLQAYALLHHYYIVTSTYTKDCQIYDITGERILDEKSDNITTSRITLNLDRPLFHENFNMDKLDELLKAHGDEVEMEMFMKREQWFILKAKKPGILARSLALKYGLEELSDYQTRSRIAINKMRGYSFTAKEKK